MTMGRLLQNLLSQRYAGLLGVVVLVLVIYLVGVLAGVPYLYLHLAALGVVVLAVVTWLWQKQKAAKAAGSLEAALKAQGQSQAAGARPDQRAGIEELKSTFDESLDLLRSSKMGRGALHSIPWYILIGPPGSGKSTLLRESGLSFPYMTKGRSAIRGLGGTKNCDWWFADRGILLDTAGRYTTEAEDRDEWMAFLRLMKRGRGQRPINGAIVAIGLAELVEATDAELSLYAENVRDRIDELTRELQIVFPIYVVFTKCDRLRGFVETFDTFNKEQRKQVWGFTFPFDRGKDFVVAEQFGKEFDELYRALCVRRTDLLASDHFKKRKAQVYAFPLQFLHLKERLQGFLSQLQQPNPYQEVSPVRGIYFTSGTQEGTTIDRILKVLRPAELELDVPQESRRCYFVDDLFNRVVFTDSTLANPTAKSLQRDRTLRIGGAIVLGVLAVATIAWRWGAMADFGGSCKQIERNIVEKGKEPTAVREALDAQLGMLQSGNHHLARGGVIDNLRLHYDRTLIAYAIERIGTFAQHEADAIKQTLPAPAAASDPTAREQAYATIRTGEQRLARIDAGVRGMRSLADGGREAAQALWREAVGTGSTAEQHLDHLLAIEGLELDIPAIAGVMKSTREQLQSLLGAEDTRDLKAAAALTLEQLLPQAWQALREQPTRFDAQAEVLDRNWGPSALAVAVKGPLFSRMSVKPGQPDLESLFVTLQQDVERAQQRLGGTSLRPLQDLVGGGWLEHVETQRKEFLRLVDDGFDVRWGELLDAVAKVARAGGDAREEDRIGSGRLAIVPELVAAYRIAREVLASRGNVSEARRAELAEFVKKTKAEHKPSDAKWAQSPGTFERGRMPEAVIDRARQALRYRDAEWQRIDRSEWGIKSLHDALTSFERALVEAICNREWAACRAEIDYFAEQRALKAWQQLTKLFPFDLDALNEAGADELAEAVRSMAELGGYVAQLEPAAAFAVDAQWTDALAKAADLGKILYGGAKVLAQPSVEAHLTVQQGGAVTAVTLQGQGRKAEIGNSADWTLGIQEPLELTILSKTSPPRSFADIVPFRRAMPQALVRNGRLKPGLWSLKRLFALGEVRPVAQDPLQRLCTLRLNGPEGDVVHLVVTVSRPDAAVVFDGDWPGDRYRPVQRIWKLP